jgi:hypothetical protein
MNIYAKNDSWRHRLLLAEPPTGKRKSQSFITNNSQSASLSWCQAPIWDPQPIFSPLSLNIFSQLWFRWCGAPSLTRSRVCSFHLLPGIASQVFLGSEFHGTHEHILLSLFLWLPQPGGPGSCICFPQEQGGPVIPLGIRLPTCACSAYYLT